MGPEGTRTQMVLGLGSNCGESIGFLRRTLQALKSSASPFQILKTSAIYESDALLPEGAPADWNIPYLNLCCLTETALDPLAALDWVKSLEHQIGRKDRGRWAPREIDIDLLAASSGAFHGKLGDLELTLPHVGLIERPFALLPFAEVAPDWRLNGPAQEIALKWKYPPIEDVPFRTRKSTQSLLELVGILNITPDSFSDGGKFLDPTHALKQAHHLIQSGASVLDIGAESTRPGAAIISSEEEWNRLEPVILQLQSEKDFRKTYQLSLDTRNATTAKRALELGVDWINDVSGGADPKLVATVGRSKASYVFMHSLSVPPSKDQILNTGQDPIEQLICWAQEKISAFQKAGLPRERLIFDPGVGFGKNRNQNLEILARAEEFAALGVRFLIGHSRKSFLSELPHLSSHRDFETLAHSVSLKRKGVDYLRVHEVQMHRAAFEALALTHDRAHDRAHDLT